MGAAAGCGDGPLTAVVIGGPGVPGAGPPAGAGVEPPFVEPPFVEIVGRWPATSAVGRLVRERDPRVAVVLDTGRAAVVAIGAVVAAAPHVPVLALAEVTDHAAALAAVRAGAAGLVVAGRADELVAAVVRTARGETVFSPGLAGVVLEGFGRGPAARSGADRLTEREAAVLRLVADGLTARQIAGRLVVSPRTVENHVQHVLRKLRLHSRAALVRYAMENGLV